MTRTARLGDVAPARPLTFTVEASDEIWQLTLDHIESGSGRLLKKDKRPAREAGSSTHWFDERYVLYSKLRPYLNKVLLPDERGIGTTELVPMLPDCNSLDRVYLAYYLRSPRFVSWVSSQTAGAKMPRVSMSTFWDHEIPLPDLEEQKRIASILDKADAIRRKRQQAIRMADEFLRSVFLDMFGDPVSNPKGWPMGSIRDLVSEASYGTSAKASEDKGRYPVLRMGNISYSGHWDFSSLKYMDLDGRDIERYTVRKGDLLFNRTNSADLVGKAAVFVEDEEMAFAGYLIRIRPSKIGNSFFLAAFLNSAYGKAVLRNMCKSIVGMANINAQELQDIAIYLPPIELQNEFQRVVQSVEIRRKTMQSSYTDLLALSGSLSARAFAGEI